MRGCLTREQGIQYADRWRLLRAVEEQEWRDTTPETRLRQTAALMESIDAMGWRKALEAEDRRGHERWASLRKRFV